MFRYTTFLLILVLGLLVAGRAQAGIILAFGGDSIGPTSAWTDGWGVNVARSGESTTWDWHANGGQPAFSYQSDGKSTIRSFRAIVAAAPLGNSAVDWSQRYWTIDVWTKESYLAKGAPIKTVSLGNTPSNWSGFQTINPLLVVPNTQPFGVPGGNTPSGTVSYELQFDLSGQQSLQDALPPGEYIIGFQSRQNSSSNGDTGILSSRVGQGLTPFYSSSLFGIEPTPVIGVLTTNQDFRWAMTMGIQNDFANGDFGLGLNGWSQTGAGTVEVVEVNGNKLAAFTAGSPVTLSQWMITEDKPMTLSFDLFGLQNSGQMDLFWGDSLLGSYDSGLFANDWKTFSLDFKDPSLFSQHNQLSFRWNGNTGDRAYLDNVQFTPAAAVPEPSTLAMMLIGGVTFSLFSRRKRTLSSTCAGG